MPRHNPASTFMWAIASFYVVVIFAYDFVSPLAYDTMRRLYAVALILALAAFWIDRLGGQRGRK